MLEGVNERMLSLTVNWLQINQNLTWLLCGGGGHGKNLK